MGFIGDLAKAILITWVAYWIIAMLYFVFNGQIGMALLFFVGLLIPLSMIAYEYRQYKKKG
ncbi:MAG: hypothetical protein ACUVQX_01120 [Candidatus Bathycorpusculaceae bacterium]